MRTSRARFGIIVAIGAGLLLAAGCLPKRSVFWSPDGRYAAFVAENRAYLTTPDGKLSEPLPDVVGGPAWFPDSRRLVLVRSLELSSWEETKRHLSDEQQQRILAAEQPVIREFLAHEGDLGGWRPASGAALADHELLALWIKLREGGQAAALKARLGDKWVEWEKFKFSVGIVQTAEVQEGRIVPGRKLAELVGVAPYAIRVSPDGTRIAYTVSSLEIEAVNRLRDEQKRAAAREAASRPAEEGFGNLLNPAGFAQGATLMLVDSDGRSRPSVVARIAGFYPEFTADGKWLVYASTTVVPTDNAMVLGSIQRVEVTAGPNGFQVGPPQPLAGIMYSPLVRIACLKDGDVLFTSWNMTLPSAGGPAGDLAWFSLSPGRRTTLAPMISDAARKSIPAEGFLFGTTDLRPDGGAITFHDGEGTIGYYAFGTDAVETINKPVKDVKVVDQASWRTNDEFSFVVGPGHEWGSKDRPEFILYNTVTKQARCISRGWPDKVLQSFLPSEPARPTSGPQ